MEKEAQVAKINAEINKELTAETSQALLATAFKGLNINTMKQAIMEGMIRGFSFKNFLEKDVYAIPFSNSYSLITSIDYIRKIANKSGLSGKSAPLFVDKDNLPLTCSITVKKVLTNGDIGEFTSLVYFSEYTTGRNLWSKKPRTMIAKVAEMHALRMAFPEELSKAFVEEEFNEVKEIVVVDTKKIIEIFSKCKTKEELKTEYKKLTQEEQIEREVLEEYKNRRALLEIE